MTTPRKPRRCQACGHATTTLAQRRSADFDHLATSSGFDPHTIAPTQWICAGETFAADGPVECLRRMTARPRR